MVLSEGQILVDGNGTHILALQLNGNLVLSRNVATGNTLLWQTSTKPSPAYHPFILYVGHTGILTLQDGHSSIIWAQPTQAPNATFPSPFSMVVQDDGNLVLYAQSTSSYWATGTNGE